MTFRFLWPGDTRGEFLRPRTAPLGKRSARKPTMFSMTQTTRTQTRLSRKAKSASPSKQNAQLRARRQLSAAQKSVSNDRPTRARSTE